jgi:hypothetical protein
VLIRLRTARKSVARHSAAVLLGIVGPTMSAEIRSDSFARCSPALQELPEMYRITSLIHRTYWELVSLDRLSAEPVTVSAARIKSVDFTSKATFPKTR